MDKPVQITFHNMEPSIAVEEKVRQHIAKLGHFYRSLTGCQVVVEDRPHHQRKGGTYNVKINLHVPGDSLHVSREAGCDRRHEDLYVVLQDAFNAARRMLEDFARRRRGDIKAHSLPSDGPPVA